LLAAPHDAKQRPDTVVLTVAHIKHAVRHTDTMGTVQAAVGGITVRPVAALTIAQHCVNPSIAKIKSADYVVLGIDNIETVVFS
jgi:hypothetical protein